MSKINQIENGLRYAVQIEGTPEEKLNLESRMKHYRVPGLSLAVINHGEIEWAAGYGVTEKDSDRPVTTQTLFQAASISKPVSALAALALAQQGALELDRDVNELLNTWKLPDNEFTSKEKVTLRRLLSHSAGLTVHGFPGYAAGEELPSIYQVLDGTPPANTEPVRVDTVPGALWRYSGGGTTLAQLLLTEAAGEPFDVLMKRLVLSPAGMVSSGYEQPLPEARLSLAATAHQSDGEPYTGGWHTYPEQAAAGLWTTASDLCRYVIEVQKSYRGVSNKVLGVDMTREMLRPQIGSWGMGPRLGGSGDTAWFSHGGSNAGFRCEMIGFIHTGQGVAVMTNGDNGSDLCGEVVRAVAAAYGWMEFLPVVKQCVDVPVDLLETYAGSYQMSEIPVKVDVSREGAQLSLTAQGLFEKVLLYPKSTNEFFVLENEMELAFSAEGEDMQLTVKIAGMVLDAKREPAQ